MYSRYTFDSLSFYYEVEMPNLKWLNEKIIFFLLSSHEYAIISFVFYYTALFQQHKEAFSRHETVADNTFFIYEMINSPSQVFILILQKCDWQVHPQQKLSLLSQVYDAEYVSSSHDHDNMSTDCIVLLCNMRSLQVLSLSIEVLQRHDYFLQKYFLKSFLTVRIYTLKNYVFREGWV